MIDTKLNGQDLMIIPIIDYLFVAVKVTPFNTKLNGQDLMIIHIIDYLVVALKVTPFNTKLNEQDQMNIHIIDHPVVALKVTSIFLSNPFSCETFCLFRAKSFNQSRPK